MMKTGELKNATVSIANLLIGLWVCLVLPMTVTQSPAADSVLPVLRLRSPTGHGGTQS